MTNWVTDTLRSVKDNLQNLVSGLGTPRDKSAYSQYVFVPLNDAQLTAAYRSDWIARKVVDIPAYDATREWRSWQANQDQIELIEEVESRLGVRKKVRLARSLARLYGGAAVIIGDGGSDPMQPIRQDKPVAKDGLKYLTAISRLKLRAGPIETDVGLDGFGLPQYYEAVSSAGVTTRIHSSRVVRFVGNTVPDDAADVNVTLGWGDSVLQAVDDAIKQASATTGAIAQLVQESKIDVISMPGLMSQINDPQFRSAVVERYQLANLGKSTFNSLLIDKEETWQRITANFTSLPDVLRLYLMIAAGAADIPATRFLSQSPTGMNATGDSDTRNHYDRIAADQADEQGPAMRLLDECIIWSALGQRPSEIYYEWNSLWQMSDDEKAALALKKAQVFQIDVASGVLPEEALREGRANQLVEDGFYPGFDQAMEEALKNEEQDLNEVDPAVVAQFEAQKGLQQQQPGVPGSNVVQLKRDAIDAEGDEADFNYVSEDGSFSGYAARWGIEYHDGYRVQRGAFVDAIGKTSGKFRLLYQHDTKLPIGMVQVEEDEVGLRVAGQLNMDLALARETKSNIQKNILNGLSIGYTAFAVSSSDVKLMVRVNLEEVSVVTFPSMEQATIDSAPRSLYVRRDVVNSGDLINWARSQGLKDTLRASDLHVTIAYSREPVDWMKMGEPMCGPSTSDMNNGQMKVPPGGPRQLDRFGPDKDAVVILFSCWMLNYRNQEMQDKGASWDYAEYQPRITIAYDKEQSVDISKLEPYRGKIVLGPEIFEEVDDNWKGSDQ